jgi:outer membrane lipoprotein-sorting protein
MPMRVLIYCLVALSALGSIVRAEPPPPAAGDPETEKVLQQLDQIGKNLKEFTAKIKLREVDNVTLNETDRIGNVWFQKRPDGTARLRVLFSMRVDPVTHDGYPKDKIEYLLDGRWLIDRNYPTKNEVKRQVLKANQKMDLFKLGEGPFPLPIGQDPRQVHELFDVKRLPPAKDDPANTVHLQLIPQPNTDLATRFHSLDVWVDAKTGMPVRVDTTDPKQQNTRSTELTDTVVNPPAGIPDTDFTLPNIDDKQWNRHVESLND